ncbi:DUF5709 domain-containing protein [Nonomuraea sp. SYSU D8015]|uniref:DUF5709 domain-containing protein n=1 Tax=Nonomuraea sp. SYSU D8015 TaxID=2593644 RepID=UPI0016604949|nr:DUF5709 domain-containing protein [Nonomuraea sp. SYSU D8015]
MSHHTPEHDPHSRFEDEGIPDLQDGTPEQQWAVDPQEAPLPADEPVAVDDYGTTNEEQIQGESLSGRLDREVPEEQPVYAVDGSATAARPPTDESDAPAVEKVTEESGLGMGSDLDTGYEPDSGVDPAWEAQPEEPSGQVWDEPRRAGRLVAPDEGAREDAEPDEVATEAGPDAGGYSAEEAAMRVEPE